MRSVSQVRSAARTLEVAWDRLALDDVPTARKKTGVALGVGGPHSGPYLDGGHVVAVAETAVFFRLARVEGGAPRSSVSRASSAFSRRVNRLTPVARLGWWHGRRSLRDAAQRSFHRPASMTMILLARRSRYTARVLIFVPLRRTNRFPD